MRRARRGMTIIEVMISIAIVVVIASMGFSTVMSAVEMNEALALGDVTSRSARVTLSRLRRELQVAYLTPNRQAQNTYITVFNGEDSNPDRLWFQSLSHQRLYKNTRESDQTELTYWVDRAPREMDPGEVLFHRESERIDQYPDEGGRIHPLAYHVKSFDLRYLDGRTNEWTDEWDTRSGDTPYMLPRAVQIGLVLLSPDPDDPERSVDVPFMTTVILENADPLRPQLGGGEVTQ